MEGLYPIYNRYDRVSIIPVHKTKVFFKKVDSIGIVSDSHKTCHIHVTPAYSTASLAVFRLSGFANSILLANND